MAEQFQAGEFNSVIDELQSLQPKINYHINKTQIEQSLQTICHTHIKQPIRINDNIFDTGTSSLTLAQIFDGINEKYPGAIDVTDIFDYPTIAELARFLEKQLHISYS